MTSRRRQLRERSRQICEEDGDLGERKAAKDRESDCDRETPRKAGRKLSRITRAGAARPCTQTSVASGSEREEEPGTNKKTPQRFPRCKPWSNINSPSNDTDQQQDIFWDPHSPTTFKLENGRKKLTANKCTVDISDIVNRIAPKNEKPSSSESSYLGIWIGEDAIPCTPVVARSRAKMHRSKVLQTEEKLMRLAKQLDSNLVRQKDQNEAQSANSDDEMFSECNAVNEDNASFLEDFPGGDDVTVGLKSVSQRSTPQRGSQKSVDQDAEAAFNELFDSSTQKYSGCLSQSLSDVFSSSGKDAAVNVKSTVHEDIKHSKMELCSEKSRSEQSKVEAKISANVNQHVRKCPELNNAKMKETVQSMPRSHDDFEDDWGNDLLEDDSFIMQVTQNPELIATPKNNMPPDKPDHTSAHRAGGGVRGTAISSYSSSKTNNFKFVPRKVNGGSEAKPSNLCSIEMTDVNTFQVNARGTNNAKAFSSTQSQMPSRPHTNPVGQMSKNSVHSMAPCTNSTLMNSAQKPCAQAVPQTRATNIKDSSTHDDWDDLKFSDEVLDMFCESDSLWEEKEDDDDLLYQVCDDVERLTQAQEFSEEICKKETPQLPNLTCQMLAKQPTSHQSKNGSPVIASSSLGSYKSSSRGVSPASFSGNCSNAYQNGSLQVANQTSSKCNSVPSGGECKTVILTSTQNPGKSVDVSCSATNQAAPSKYSFTRIKPSQAPSLHTTQSAGNWSTHNDRHLQSFGDRLHKSIPVFPTIPDSVGKPQPSSIKRHQSETTTQSSKVFIPEDQHKKYSMEEIERKKQEALARRKMKARACSSDIAPT